MTRDAVLLAAAHERLEKKRARKVGLGRYAPKPQTPKLSGFAKQQSY
jgi:hypothetical protein